MNITGPMGRIKKGLGKLISSRMVLALAVATSSFVFSCQSTQEASKRTGLIDSSFESGKITAELLDTFIERLDTSSRIVFYKYYYLTNCPFRDKASVSQLINGMSWEANDSYHELIQALEKYKVEDLGGFYSHINLAIQFDSSNIYAKFYKLMVEATYSCDEHDKQALEAYYSQFKSNFWIAKAYCTFLISEEKLDHSNKLLDELSEFTLVDSHLIALRELVRASQLEASGAVESARMIIERNHQRFKNQQSATILAEHYVLYLDEPINAKKVIDDFDLSDSPLTLEIQGYIDLSNSDVSSALLKFSEAYKSTKSSSSLESLLLINILLKDEDAAGKYLEEYKSRKWPETAQFLAFDIATAILAGDSSKACEIYAGALECRKKDIVHLLKSMNFADKDYTC